MVQLDLKAFPPIYSQGSWPTCTSNALAALIGYRRDFEPSRMFLSFNEKQLSMPSCVEGMRQFGVCAESVWPYTHTPSEKPSPEAYQQALEHRLTGDWVERNLDRLRETIDRDQPFVFGFAVYENFRPIDGVVPMPAGRCTGRHAVCCVGYDDEKQLFYCRNSWGDQWDPPFDGYFYMHYAYVCSSEADYFFTLSNWDSCIVEV